MQESDLIGLYISFSDNKGTMTANVTDKKTVLDLPDNIVLLIKQLLVTHSNEIINR
jgi:hypothetical protein